MQTVVELSRNLVSFRFLLTIKNQHEGQSRLSQVELIFLFF